MRNMSRFSRAALRLSLVSLLTAILGAGQELVSSNDTVRDRRDRERFLAKYRQMHRLVREPDGAMELVIGAENWPFPIPLAFADGAWHFDAQTGMEEVRFRRIGENELSTIDLCQSLGSSDDQQILGNTAPVNGYLFRKLQAPGKGAILSFTVEVKAIGVEPVHDSLFAVPAGYKRVN